MEESYCGRSCRECTKKELIRCYGCKTETINHLGNDCELAKCAYDKGLDSCRMCENKGTCSGLKTREEMPNYQSRESQNVYLVNTREEKRKEMLARRAPLLGKWLEILFWIPIFSIGPLILTIIPNTVLYILGTMLSIVLGIARGGILIKISSEERRYRTAGICVLITTVVDKVLLGLDTSEGIWTVLFVTIPIGIIGYVAMYNEFMAHAIVLENVDDELSDKWRKLWMWYIGSMIAMVGSVVLLVFVPVLGIMIMLAAAIVLIVSAVLSWVYLYRTAKVFRTYR